MIVSNVCPYNWLSAKPCYLAFLNFVCNGDYLKLFKVCENWADEFIVLLFVDGLSKDPPASKEVAVPFYYRLNFFIRVLFFNVSMSWTFFRW